MTDSLPNDTSPLTRRGFLTDEANLRYSASIGRECAPDVSSPGCTTTARAMRSSAMHSVW